MSRRRRTTFSRRCVSPRCAAARRIRVLRPREGRPHPSAARQFRDWALELSRDLANAGAWTDYIDPCSGLPVSAAAPQPRHCAPALIPAAQALSDASNAVYPEVDGFEALLHYRASSAAGCRVILHPRWGTHVYPATVFTTAHPDAVLAAVKKRSARQEEGRRHAAPPRD